MGLHVAPRRRQADPRRVAEHAGRWDSGGLRDVRPAAGPFLLTEVSWSASEAVSFEEWVLSGRQLGAIGRGVGWWIGDWLRFGNARYGEKYAQASKITGYDTQTLMNMVYVASSIEVSRRRDRLSWSHHAEVAATAPEQQDHWLDRAEESRLSVHDLRQLLGRSRKRDRDAAAGASSNDRIGASTDNDHATVCPECGHAFQAQADPTDVAQGS